MRKALFATVLALVNTAAIASDINPARRVVPLAPVWSWTGFYVGGNVGYANSYENETISGNNAVSGLVVGTGGIPSSSALNANGWMAGGQIGYNYQFGEFVAGVEADFDWSDVKGSSNAAVNLTAIGLPVTLATTETRGSDWLGTVRGRLGTTILDPRTLLYATGGGAYANVHGTTTSTLNAFGKTFSASDSYSTSRFGWTVGGGVEAMLTQHWTWKAEYLYIDLGSHDGDFATVVGGTPVSFHDHQNLTEHLLRGGINYKF